MKPGITIRLVASTTRRRRPHRDVRPDLADLAVLDQHVGLREIADLAVEREHHAALEQDAARGLQARQLVALRVRGVGRTAAPAASTAPDVRKRRRDVFVGPLRIAVTPVRPHHLTGKVRKPTLRHPHILSGAGCCRPYFFTSPKRGVRSAERRPTNFAPLRRRCASLAIGMPAFRRSTAASPVRVSMPCVSASGRAFAGTFPGRQRAPRGRLIVACRAEPRSRPGAWLLATPAGPALSRPHDV